MSFPELSTERLLLQRILPADQAFIFEGLSHPSVIPFYGVRYESFDATGVQMDWYEKMLQEGTGFAWKMVEKKSGAPVGVISVYYYKEEHRKAETGFWLLPDFWSKGYASEALKEVILYCKEQMHLHRLEAFVEEGNKASCFLLEKNGFQHEGLMKDCEKKEGRFISLHIYALLF